LPEIAAQSATRLGQHCDNNKLQHCRSHKHNRYFFPGIQA
jgi:hypothetical protein